MMQLNRKLSFLLSNLRFLFIFVIGFILFYSIFTNTFYSYTTLEYAFYFLIAFVVLLAVVAFLISEWVKQQSPISSAYHYGRKEIITLFVRTMGVVGSGYLLATYFVHLSEPAYSQKVLFLAIDLFLTLYAVSSIFKTERIRELNLHNIRSENQVLKSQLNPHFLYNTLNNIDALIYYDADKASQAVITLSSLMRYQTYQANKRSVLLSQEINHISEYISLQRLRVEDEEAVLWDIEVHDDPAIAPMLLMPIIENCFKHAARFEQKDDICIYLRAQDGVLHLITENKCTAKQPPRDRSKSGVGLDTLSRRLELLYPDTHLLKAVQLDDVYRLTLSIKYEDSNNENSI